MNDNLKSSPALINFVCGWEKFAPKPYKDQANLWTWGYGHCQKPGERLPIRIDEAEGARIMSIDLVEAERAVKRGIRIELTQNEFDALVSLAFNCGDASVNGSTLAGVLNNGFRVKAAEQLLRWDKVRQGGKLVSSPGLAKRRAAERRIFVEGIYDSTH